MSDGGLRLVAAALALAGLCIAGYLAVTWYADSAPVCVGGTSGCEAVQGSNYADFAGVPVALLGAIGYALILATLAVPGDLGRMAGALLALVGFGFSLYLTWVSAFVIEALCQWCLASTAVMSLLAVVTVYRVAREPDSARSRGPGR